MGQSVFDAITYKRAPHRERFKEPQIISECINTDLFCLQEILSHDAQRFFDKISRKYFSTRTRDHNRFGVTSLRGSGLGIASRFHIERRHFYYFKNKGLSWDRLARKGILYTRVKPAENTSLDIFVVHLQSGFDAKSATSRAGQLAELKHQIEKLADPMIDCIVCGDFNIDGSMLARETEYATLTYALEGFEDMALQQDEPTFHPAPDGNLLAHLYEPGGVTRRIDYIFFRPARQKQNIYPHKCELALRHPVLTKRSGKFIWPSDHFAVRAEFTLEN